MKIVVHQPKSLRYSKKGEQIIAVLRAKIRRSFQTGIFFDTDRQFSLVSPTPSETRLLVRLRFAKEKAAERLAETVCFALEQKTPVPADAVEEYKAAVRAYEEALLV